MSTPPKQNPLPKTASAPTGDADLAKRIKAAQGETSYLASEKERNLYHVKLDLPAFDTLTGQRKGPKPFIQKFTVPDWKHFLKHGDHLGYTVAIMWNPEAFLGTSAPVAGEGDE